MGKQRQKVVPGGEIEFDALTHAEAMELAQAFFRKTVSERVRAQNGGKTDAAGAASIDVYTVPLGQEFRLCRVVVEADGFTFAALFTNAAGAVTIQRGGQMNDGFNLSAGLPNVWSAGSGASPRYVNGEKVTIVVVGGPANTNISVRIEGDQFPDHAPSSA